MRAYTDRAIPLSRGVEYGANSVPSRIAPGPFILHVAWSQAYQNLLSISIYAPAPFILPGRNPTKPAHFLQYMRLAPLSSLIFLYAPVPFIFSRPTLKADTRPTLKMDKREWILVPGGVE